MYKVTSKEQPKWYNFRWKLSNFFVKIGQKIYPENPEVKAFWLQIISDQMIYGNSVVRINPKETVLPL